MARVKREVSSSGIYKINLRGNDGDIFKSEKDYEEFVSLLGKYFAKDKAIVAYSLNPESADLIVMTPNDSIGVAMKPFLTSYARYFNRTYERTGKVFYDRYKSEPVDADEIDEAALSMPDGAVVKNDAVAIGIIGTANEEKEEKTEEEKEIKREEKKMDFWLL